MSNAKRLYEQCADCKFAVRNKGGNPVGCLIRGGAVVSADGQCSDFAFWWTNPHYDKDRFTKTLLFIFGMLTLLIGAAWLCAKLLKSIAPGINKDNLSLYLPGYKRK